MARTVEAHEVPQAVKDAFAQLFPEATAENWEVESEYEVEFTKDGKEVEVNFYPDGNLAQIEYTIDPEELPEEVKSAIKANYPHCEIEDAERVEKPDGTVLYEVDLSFEVHFTPGGKVAALGKDL